jgi:D-cysteine desulfhydrase
VRRRLHARLAQPPACLSLADLPTPVERAEWLDVSDRRVWVKREDRSSALYGGGKVRKLEWLLANPPYDDARPIVTIGGHGSHHLLATGLFLSELGRELHAVMFEQEPTEHAYRNVAVLASIGARFWSSRRRVGLPLAMASYYLWRRPPTMGHYLTPGGSTALGSFGCVEAGLELAAQIAAGELVRPDRIYVTAGTAGTSAGIAIGMALCGQSTHLRLVSAAEPIGFNRLMFSLKLREVFRALRGCGLDHPARSVRALLEGAGVDWSIEYEQLGGGYGVPTAAAHEAVAFAEEHGLSLETTYTGKCLAALRSDLEAGIVPDGTNVLFWNSHGANDLSAHVREGWQARLPPAFARRLESAHRRALEASGA